MNRGVLTLLALMLSAAAYLSFAQQSTAQITGALSDTSGALCPAPSSPSSMNRLASSRRP